MQIKGKKIMMKVIDDIEAAFKHLCAVKHVAFVCSDKMNGYIDVKNGSIYQITYTNESPYTHHTVELFGHNRLISYIKNHNPRMIFVFDPDSVQRSKPVVEPPSIDYIVNMSINLRWRSPKEMVSVSDICKGYNGIVVLIASGDSESTTIPRNEDECRDQLNRSYLRIEENSFLFVNHVQGISAEESAKTLNDKFNAFLIDFYRDGFNPMVETQLFPSDYTNSPPDGAWLYHPSRMVIGWMMSYEYHNALKKAFHSQFNLADLCLRHFSHIVNIGHDYKEKSWRIYEN